MNDKVYNTRYGRGLPTYLLCRTHSQSTIFSDGASRIFALSDTSTSAKDTDYSASSHCSMSVSSTNWSTTDIESHSTSSSSISKMMTNNSESDMDCASSETRTNSCYNSSFTRTNSQSTLTPTVYDREDAEDNDKNVEKKDEHFISGIAYLAGCVALVVTQMENNNQTMDVRDNIDSNINNYSVPKNMVELLDQYPIGNTDQESEEEALEKMSHDEEEESPIILPDTILPAVSYKECCLWGDPRVSECGPSAQRYFMWKAGTYKFENLVNSDIRKHLKRLGVIKKESDDNIIVNERNLIANRLLGKNIIVDNTMSICPKHRSSFGIDWCDVTSTCNHPAHDPKRRPSPMDCRQANLNTCSKIEGFPIGGRLCSTHRKSVSAPQDAQNFASFNVSSMSTDVSTFQIDDTRQQMNQILYQVDVSPIRSQTKKPLKKQSKGAIRRILSKLNQGVQIFQEKLAETLAPGEKDELLKLAKQSSDSQKNRQVDMAFNNEIIDNLKDIYCTYVKQKMPFVEQVRIISLLPRSMSYEDIMKTFGCSKHAIKCAHRMKDENDYMLQLEKEPAIRQRADPNKIKHFVSWLVESSTLVSGTYGLTTLKMDSGEKLQLSKQILQSQKTHAIANYKKYCEETDFESLGNRKLFDILSGLKPEQQRIVAGLDDFVVEGVEAWQTLSNIVSSMPVPQTERKRLLKQIEMAEQYQKTIHTGHCSEDSDCISHCTTFGLSDPKCSDQHRNCSQSHTFDCPDCINIVRTLDEIQERIEQLSNEEVKREAKYDFENATQHIIEWSRHNIRAAQQNDSKNKIISKMESDEAFCTFDWGQKILPQEFRESQNTYFGKKGMSVLVGSFVWKNSTKNVTVTDSNSPEYHTESYILALTNASQTDLDSLSGSELIIKEFKKDHKHITKLHKRTDNAGNFSSHSTPEIEMAICDQLGIRLLTRDYSEVQKGKDICDRVCGVAKARMRSWAANGNDLLCATDIKEGMEYSGGVKNTKIAVAEIVSGMGVLGKTNIPNISTVRCIQYESKFMKVFKASNIGDGIKIPYKNIEFETNMRLTSPFTMPIATQQHTMTSNKRNDRMHHQLLMCPVNGCTTTFESEEDLNSHIAANLHKIPPPDPRTANDIARLHLVDTVRSVNIQSHHEAKKIKTNHISSTDSNPTSLHYKYLSSVGWALRTRKHNNIMTDKAKQFIKDMWLNSQTTGSKLTPEQLQQELRSRRDQNTGLKLFQPHEYPTINQIKYRFRKLGAEYEITNKQQLIDELVEENKE